MPPRVALVLFASLLAVELLPQRGSLTNATTEADDIPPRETFTPPAKPIPLELAERCGPDEDADMGPDLRRALFGDEPWEDATPPGEGEPVVRRRSVRIAQPSGIAGNVTLVRDAHAHPLRE